MLVALLAIALILYILNPSYVILLVKVILSLVNFVFALFVFRHLLDMNNHYKSKFYSILFFLGIGALVVPSIILLNLFFLIVIN
jgi:hypothetical protein